MSTRYVSYQVPYSILIRQAALLFCGKNINPNFHFIAILDRWAALWPFLGIVIEVTLLVSIILVYERYELRKNPTAAEPVTPASAATAAAAAPSETTSPNGNAP